MALPSKLGRVAIKSQASSWGTAETSFATTDFLEVDGIVIPQLVTEALRTDTFRPDFTEPETVAGSKAGVEVSISFPLHGWSSATPSANPAAFHPDGLLIENALRGSTIISAGYLATNIAAGSTTTLVAFTTGSTTYEGQALLMTTTSTSLRDVCWVRDIDTTPVPDTGSCWKMRNAATVSTTHFGSITIPLTTTQPVPLTMEWLGIGASHNVRFFDGIVTKATITLAAKKQPKCDITLRFLDWTPIGSGGAPAAYTYGFPQMPAITGNNGAYKTENNTATAAFQGYSQAVINIAVTAADSDSASGLQGADSQVVTERRVTVEITEPYVEATQPYNTWAGITPGTDNNELVLVANTTPGRAFSAVISESIVLEQTYIQDSGGIIAVRRLFGCRPYATDGGTGAGAGNTPFRVAFL